MSEALIRREQNPKMRSAIVPIKLNLFYTLLSTSELIFFTTLYDLNVAFLY
jgi:hypothetical protein